MADKSKDTGTGGINIDGKVYTPDVGVSNSDGGPQGNYSSGDVAVDKTVKDLSKPTRETFAKYLSKTTLGTAGNSPHGNTYPVGSGDSTTLQETPLKDVSGNPVSPGPQNNDTKFASGFNQTISSNNPAGIRRGLATGPGPDGNVLLPNASQAAPAGGNYVKFVSSGLNEPIKSYTATTIDSNLNDYNNVPIVLADGALGAPPQNIRENLKYIPADASIDVDGGTSVNILGPDASNAPDYTLTFKDATTYASSITSKNSYEIDAPQVDLINNVEVVRTNKLFDVDGNPISATASQDNPFNSNFFTKDVQVKKDGTKKVFTKLQSSYTNAFALATSDSATNINKFEIKRGKSAASQTAPDGHELLQTIAPESGGKAILTPSAENYVSKVTKPNLYKADPAMNFFTQIRMSDGGVNQFDVTQIPVHVTYGIAEDAGMSANVLSDADAKRTLSLTERAMKAAQVTGGAYNTNFNVGPKQDIKASYVPNSYPIGAPLTDLNGDVVVSTILDNFGYPISPTNAQGQNYADKYEAFFAQLQTSYSQALAESADSTKTGAAFQIKRGKSSVDIGFNIKPIPDGHKLLPLAAKPAPEWPPVYIKSTDLSDGMNAYVSAVLQKNRFNPVDADANGVPKKFTGDDQSTDSLLNPINKLGYASPFGSQTQIDPRSIFNRNASFAKPSSLRMGSSTIAEDGSQLDRSQYNFQRLSKIGTVLQLMATGEVQALVNPGLDPRNPLAQLASQVPGVGQLGAGVPLPSTYLDTSQIIEVLDSTGDDDPTSVNTSIFNSQLLDFNRQYEGVINSCMEKFSGFSSLGILLLAAVLVAVIVGAFELIAAISKNTKASSVDGNKAAQQNGIRSLGSFHGKTYSMMSTNFVVDLVSITKGGGGWSALFGIAPTYNRSYLDAVTVGMRIFFGLNDSPPPGLAMPGTLVIAARSIIRSATRIILAFKELTEAAASTDITSAVFQLIEIIDIIKNSRFIRSCNTFAQLGDKKPNILLSGKYDLAELNDPGDQLAVEPLEGGISSAADTKLLAGKRSFSIFEVQNNDFDIGKKISEIDTVDDAKKPNMAARDAAYSASKWISTAHAKNRIRGSSKLAWSSYRSPSLLLVPSAKFEKQISGSMDLPGAPLDAPKFKNDLSYVRYVDDGSRIPPESVKFMEDTLDGEHMPFYMQDLRTNEIISFHAFLTSLTDDYSANYESAEGIGRIEPIKTYRSTQRKIGISFILAALDEQDFDHMWEKVNKLTTLVYPQYTAGKEYNNPGSGYKFEKPFTQMIGAAPMIRIRLGNLLRSNYSRFNLAGVFGLHGKDNAIADEKKYNEAVDPRVIAAKAKRADAGVKAAAEFDNDPANKYFPGAQFRVAEGLYYTTPPLGSPASIPDPSIPSDKVPAAAAKQAAVRKQQAQKIAAQNAGLKKQKKSSVHYNPGDGKNPPGDWYYSTGTDMPEDVYFQIADEPLGFQTGFVQGRFVSIRPGADKDSPTTPDETFYVPIDKLGTLSEATAARYRVKKQEAIDGKQAAAGPVSQTGPNRDEQSRGIVGFMQPEKNAIVRSFESTGGKGLAGFIDSINFDWYDRTTWDLRIDRKAPKMCKVTISFTPVHDISPGLDKFGHNRAPIYPLGVFEHGTRKVTIT